MRVLPGARAGAARSPSTSRALVVGSASMLVAAAPFLDACFVDFDAYHPRDVSDAARDALVDASSDPSAFDAPTQDRSEAAAALIDDHFETATTCDGWTTGFGGSALPSGEPRGGARACLFCSPTSDGYMTKTVAVSETGSYQLLAWVRAPDGSASRTALSSLGVYDDVGGQIASLGNSVPTSSTWSPLQIVEPVDRPRRTPSRVSP